MDWDWVASIVSIILRFKSAKVSTRIFLIFLVSWFWCLPSHLSYIRSSWFIYPSILKEQNSFFNHWVNAKSCVECRISRVDGKCSCVLLEGFSFGFFLHFLSTRLPPPLSISPACGWMWKCSFRSFHFIGCARKVDGGWKVIQSQVEMRWDLSLRVPQDDISKVI